MKLPHRIVLASAASALASACVHTPPGTSVEIALAKRAQLIRLPSAPEPIALARIGNVHVPPVEPELPIMEDRVEAEAEAFTRGKFAMADGNDEEPR